jgi:hypothetical protein
MLPEGVGVKKPASMSSLVVVGSVKRKMLILDRHWTCDGDRVLKAGRSA